VFTVGVTSFGPFASPLLDLYTCFFLENDTALHICLVFSLETNPPSYLRLKRQFVAGCTDNRFFFLLAQSEMPPTSTQDTMMPEAKGLKYDESEMALFRAKLSYHATIDDRLASHNTNLLSIAEAQARILKGWEIQMQKARDMSSKDGGCSASDMRAIAQFEWRYKALENAATKDMEKR
jgi:hypothetical protein